MGQKSNIVTLRVTEKYLHLYRLSNTEFLYGFYFSNLLKNLFNLRKVFVTSLILNFSENKIYIYLDLFFRAAKVLFFKKAKFIPNFNKTHTLAFFTSLNLLRKKKIVFNFNIINLKLKKKKIILFNLFKVNKRYAFSMFPRRFNFFLDFLKLSILFKENDIKASFFLTILAEVFRILQKKKHAKFLFFLNKHFKNLISLNYATNASNLLGIKFIIRGKLKGKRRKSNAIINCGQIPVQSLSKQIEFAKTHAFTVYGTFGLKLWVYRSNFN
jgi:hypothetical protein